MKSFPASFLFHSIIYQLSSRNKQDIYFAYTEVLYFTFEVLDGIRYPFCDSVYDTRIIYYSLGKCDVFL